MPRRRLPRRRGDRRAQQGKHKKRPKGWHRGQAEALAWKRGPDLPATGTAADPTGAPTPLPKVTRKRYRGDQV